jgi:hypothetical protein
MHTHHTSSNGTPPTAGAAAIPHLPQQLTHRHDSGVFLPDHQTPSPGHPPMTAHAARTLPDLASQQAVRTAPIAEPSLVIHRGWRAQ